jgi:hypothetical protein
MKIKEYIDKISQTRNSEDMEKLSDILEETMYDLKEYDETKFYDYKMQIYEIANGKTLSMDMADDWVKSMQPAGLHWTIEETTSAMQKLGYNLDKIEFYVVANMMYNDYFDIVREDETMALKLAYDWLKDVDAKDDKLYCYWKYIAK